MESGKGELKLTRPPSEPNSSNDKPRLTIFIRISLCHGPRKCECDIAYDLGSRDERLDSLGLLEEIAVGVPECHLEELGLGRVDEGFVHPMSGAKRSDKSKRSEASVSFTLYSRLQASEPPRHSPSYRPPRFRHLIQPTPQSWAQYRRNIGRLALDHLTNAIHAIHTILRL